MSTLGKLLYAQLEQGSKVVVATDNAFRHWFANAESLAAAIVINIGLLTKV